jgi:hypothetical protein
MTKKLSITDIHVSNLVPNSWNTNRVNPENEQKIIESFKRLDMFRPILVRESDSGMFEILGGQHRWQVAKKLGYETVPVINLGKIDDNKAKEIGLVDNARYGEDDQFMLADLLKELGNADDILAFMPYTADEFDDLFTNASIALDGLSIDDDEQENPLALSELAGKVKQTHQIMRFKVPVEDAETIEKLIDVTMRTQDFNDDDSLANAGNALVHLLRNIK